MTGWISIKDRLPEHEKTILIYSYEGLCVCVFVESKKMNQSLNEYGYGHESVDINIHPFYFASQERNGYTLNGVTHWMPLPEPPT